MKSIGKNDDTPMVKEQRQKIDCPLIGTNGHIMNLFSISVRKLIENGQENEALTKSIIPC